MPLRGLRTNPPWLTVLLCCAAQFMVVLDVTIVNVALPGMRHDLGLSVNSQQWVINAYTLAFAGFLMLGGRAADLFGRRWAFLVGMAVFTVCSLLGGLAQNGSWLITARAAQGFGSAVLAPATLSLLTGRFTGPHERRRAIGAWSTTAACGAAIGVLVGGVLTDLLDWRWVLFVNVPIGAAVFVLAILGLSESRGAGAAGRLDIVGAVTVTAGLAVVVYGIVETNTHPWGTPRTLVVLAVGVILLAVFCLVETRFAADPLVPFSVFRRRSLTIANCLAVVLGTALFGTYFFLSLYLQQVAGYSPLRAGLAFLPIGISTFVGSTIGTRTVQNLGFRIQLVGGLCTAGAGLLWIGTTLEVQETYLSGVLWPLILFGLGTGLSIVPLTIAGTQGVPPEQAGLASGLINTTRQIGGAVGLAAMATAAAGVTNGDSPVGAKALAAALTDGYGTAFVIAGCVCGAGALLALGLPAAASKKAPQPASDVEDDATASPSGAGPS